MGFRELEIKPEYRSLLGDVVKDFYTPVLSESVLYRRAVGFFSSSSLISLTNGLKGLLLNNGTIEVIASPRLSEGDIEAINDGLARRDDIILEALIRELGNPAGKFEEDRLNLLSNLIASKRLTIKIAALEAGNKIGMFHEKLGLMFDAQGDTIAFSGSMNESSNAFSQNYEAIDVFLSWTSDLSRVKAKSEAFQAMWNDYEPGIKVFDFPDVSEAIIERYKISDTIDLSILDDMPAKPASGTLQTSAATKVYIPKIPAEVKIRKYQSEAIAKWKADGYRGIFDMATGTGKTYTALAAIAALSDELDHNLAVVIVCPYQHLVEQWVEDIVNFGMNPIVCYSASSQKNWRDRVKNSVAGFRIDAIQSFCIVTTNATFSTDFMQEQISRLKGNCLIVADEAHNFGANKLFDSLPNNFPFRLALSATIDRHGDAEGTAKLFDYFGEKCINYTLEDAINNHMLTPYYYHPIEVTLDDQELEEYLVLTKKIGKFIASSRQGVADLPESAKMLLIKRARLVAGARGKISALRSALQPFVNDNHILVYCGATTIRDADYIEGAPEVEDIRQIDKVSEMLGLELGMRVSQFTSRENAEKRALLKEEFSQGGHMQALIAIRCLDEGVNIPCIEKAFILASSTNPKEYIQRRGRVLRLAPGKDYATIFDFITLPFSLEKVGDYPEEVVQSAKSLVIREMVRMRDFARIAENPAETLRFIGAAIEAFGITPEDEERDAYV